MSVNKVILVGRLGKDPELRYTQTGQPVATLSLATSETYRSQDGTSHEKTEWHRIIVWGNQAENVNTYLSKGSQVYIEGSLEYKQWKDKEGVTRYTTEVKAGKIQFLDNKKQEGQTQQYQGGQAPAQQGQSEQPQEAVQDGPQDVPF